MTPYHTFRRWIIARAIRRSIGPQRRKAQFYRMAAELNAGDFSSVLAIHVPGAPAETPRPQREPASRTPGRQRIAMPGELTPYGMTKPWTPPIPSGARSAAWEDLHTFAPGCRPKRHSEFGLIGHEPPLALVCVACELEQTPIRSTSEDRACPYCGLRYRSHGTRVFWWRDEITVPDWSPR